MRVIENPFRSESSNAHSHYEFGKKRVKVCDRLTFTDSEGTKCVYNTTALWQWRPEIAPSVALKERAFSKLFIRKSISSLFMKYLVACVFLNCKVNPWNVLCEYWHRFSYLDQSDLLSSSSQLLLQAVVKGMNQHWTKTVKDEAQSDLYITFLKLWATYVLNIID